jgi:transcriptional regulator with XRE-family HTH domain/ribosomal protein L37E
MLNRDAVKCRDCGLSQYMTKDELCRRCRHPLTLIKYFDMCRPSWRNRLPIVTMSASAVLPKKNFAKQLGLRIRHFRKIRGLRREDLGHIMLSSSFSRLENGAHYPSIAVIERLAAAFHISIAELLLNSTTSGEDERDYFVEELSLYLRVLPWERWVEVFDTMKQLLRESGVESLRIRASLEQKYNPASEQYV